MEAPVPDETTEPEEPDTGKNNNGNGNDNGNNGNHSGWYKDSGVRPRRGRSLKAAASLRRKRLWKPPWSWRPQAAATATTATRATAMATRTSLPAAMRRKPPPLSSSSW